MIPALVLAAAALAVAGPAADAAAKKTAEALVARLGAPRYRDREQAARDLLELGHVAMDAVRAGQGSADPEVSQRCTALYPAIWRHHLDRRVQRFLDRPDRPIPDDLPGAARWLKIAGEGKESRELYAEMVKAHPEPLLQAELNPERLRDVYLEFVKGVYARIYGRRPVGAPVERPTPADGEVLVFLFLGAAGDVRPAANPGTSATYYYQFLNAPYTARLLSADPPAVPFRKLYAAWLEKERYSLVLRRGIDIAAQHGVKECAPTALRIAADPGTPVFIRSTALLGFARLGSKEDIKELAPFLADKATIANVVVNGERGTVQVRDVALGAAVQLAGQNLSDFGFERRPPAGLAVTTYTYYAFGTDEKREAAHTKWQAWAKENLSKK